MKLKCEKCREEYILGKNTLCFTSEELRQVMGAVIGNLPSFLLVSHPKEKTTQETLTADEATIKRLGPVRGWECDKCKFTNKWNPVYS